MAARLLLAVTLLLLTEAPLCAQHSTVISDAEEEQIRDAAPEPAKRVAVYQEIIETRIRKLQQILADRRAQGRREDIQENLDRISGLLDEFEDNLDEYDKAHRDLRKALPKLTDAMLRWESVLKQLPDDAGYDLTRKLALEAIADVQRDATEILPEQKAYFKAHPPDKNANPGGIGEIHPQ